MPCPSDLPRLAIDGGSPLRSEPWPAWPYFDPETIEAASAVLRSGKVNYWTGSEGRAFEEEFAAAVGCRYGVAVGNGTLALELALRSLEIGPGDEVVVTCRSFFASAGCARTVGATPVFADVDPVSQNLTADTIRAVVTPRTKAIIAVHLAGWPCEMDPILELAQQRRLWVIEDCAQAHGATYRGRPVGSLGHLAAFSFCQDKILSTGGEGGLLTTNDEPIWRKAWSYKDHGKSWDAVHNRSHATVFKWLHESFGSNWRMTEFQAAIGRVLLRKLPYWVQVRRSHAELLHRRLAALPALRRTLPPAHIGHSYYKYYAFLRPEQLRPGWDRDRVVRAVQAEGIPCGSGVCPEIYREVAFAQLPAAAFPRLPVAATLGDSSLMLLVHPTLSQRDINSAASALEKVLQAATLASSLSAEAA